MPLDVGDAMKLSLRPATLAEANAFVAAHHSHHRPVVGHKFSIACEEGDRLCGVVIVSRPVAQSLATPRTLELTRVCTDRTPNAASKLVAAATRAALAMGATRVISYVLESEEGVSYRAAGWTRVDDDDGNPIAHGGGKWNSDKRGGQTSMIESFGIPEKHPIGPKHRWEKCA